jgi:hypothetical protein
MPFLQELRSILYDQCLKPSQFPGTEAVVRRQTHGIEPELRRGIVPIDVHMRGLDDIVTEETDTVWPVP